MGVFELTILMFFKGFSVGANANRYVLPLTVILMVNWWQILCVVRKAHIPFSMSSMSFIFKNVYLLFFFIYSLCSFPFMKSPVTLGLLLLVTVDHV